MSENLISSIEDVLNSRKGSTGRLNYVLNILKQEGASLFPPLAKKEEFTSISESHSGQPSSSIKKRFIQTQKMSEQEKILKIIDEFIDEFEASSLPSSVSVKNYVQFLLIILKILRKLKITRERSLNSAHVLSRLDQMFAKHPINYNRRATRDPLGLLFLITELTIEAGLKLESPYRLDENTSIQFVPLVTNFCMNSQDPLDDLVKAISDMPKFRLSIVIGVEHRKIMAKIFQDCLPKIPLKTRIENVKKLMARITLEKNDSVVLMQYDTLKLFLKDDVVKTYLAKMATSEKEKNHRFFVKEILEELSGSRNVN